MNSVTLILPGRGVATGAVNIDYVGDGIVTEAIGAGPVVPHYFETNQDAKEFVISRASDYLRKGYRVFTGDGITA